MLHVTKGCGKMNGINSINVSSLENPFCIKNSKNENSVCSKCYSNRYSRLRPPLEKCLLKNTEILTKTDLEFEDIPVINALYFRFNSFGELYNLRHFINLLRICRKNPKTTFSLWTKRKSIIRQYDQDLLPKNLILIYSEPLINEINLGVESFDKTFNVVTKEFSKDSNIINCSKKCLECLKCYTKNSLTTIIEKIK